MKIVDVMKTVNQIFGLDQRVTALKIQAKIYLISREKLEWRMIKKCNTFKILNPKFT